MEPEKLESELEFMENYILNLERIKNNSNKPCKSTKTKNKLVEFEKQNGIYIVTGNTFPIKDYIKTNLHGKWNSDLKRWEISNYIDEVVVNLELNQKGYTVEFH